MNTAIAPRPNRRLAAAGAAAGAVTTAEMTSAGMTACRIAGLAFGALVVGLVLSQVPDMIRYYRMTRM